MRIRPILESVILCRDFLEHEKTGEPVVIGLLEAFAPKTLPATFDVQVLLAVVAAVGPHEIRCVLLDPDENAIADVSAEIPADDWGTVRARLKMPRFTIEHRDSYRLQIWFDGTVLHEKVIPVTFTF